MKRICYGLFFLLPLLGCRSTAPEEAVETTLVISDTERAVSYASREGLWENERCYSVLDTLTHSSLICDTLSQPDVYTITKGWWDVYRTYMEPGDRITLHTGERGEVVFEGSEEAVLRNNLYTQLQALQKPYASYRREFLRCKRKGEPCKKEPVDWTSIKHQCNQLIEIFKANKKGNTPAFERFLALDLQYFEILNAIEFPPYKQKTYHPFTPDEIKRMAQCKKDSRYPEALLSFNFRQVLKAYLDYLRIEDPSGKCKFGKDFIQNEMALAGYFDGEQVRNFVKSHCLSAIAYECAAQPSLQAAVQSLPSAFRTPVKHAMKSGLERLSLLKVKPFEFPDFTGKDVSGKERSLKDFRGKYVLVDVWATWCGVCQGEFKYTNAMEPFFEGKDVVFLGVSVDKESDREKWIQNIADKELKGIQINISDPKEKDFFCRQLGVTGYPHYALIGPDGKLLIEKLPKPSTGVQHQILKGYLEE